MNAPTQKPMNQATAGDLISPDGTSWYRVTLVTGGNLTMHGPVTPEDMSAGINAPIVQPASDGLAWFISDVSPNAPADPVAAATAAVQATIPGTTTVPAPPAMTGGASTPAAGLPLDAAAWNDLLARVERIEQFLEAFTVFQR